MKVKRPSAKDANMDHKIAIGRRIKEFRVEILGGKRAHPIKWTQPIFAKICGITTQAVSQWENADKSPDQKGGVDRKNIDALVDFFGEACGLTHDWILKGKPPRPHAPTKHLHFSGVIIQPYGGAFQEADLSQDTSTPHNQSLFYAKNSSASAGLSPIFATYEAQGGTLIMLKSKIVGHINAPAALSEVFESVYSFKMPTADMDPMYAPGHILVVDPTHPPEPGKGVVLFKADRQEFIVRRMIRANPTQWVVQKYGETPREEKLLREEWPIAEFIFSSQWG